MKTDDDFALYNHRPKRYLKGTYTGMCGGVLAIEYATDTWFLEQDELEHDTDTQAHGPSDAAY